VGETISSCGSNMFRYLFSVQDAASVVQNAINEKEICYGRVLVKEMKSVKIIRLLDLVCSQSGISYKLLPPRQGERTTEYLVGSEEMSMSRRITLSSESYILIDFANNSYSDITQPLSAETATPLSDTELISLINNMRPL
jgi:FlaA1/EpsC-like NDP-sugar epimerase